MKPSSKQILTLHIPAVLAELCGTAVLLFLGCLGCLPFYTPFHAALSFGGALAVAIQTFGHISGGHFNPAVTISAFIFNLTPLPLVAAYIIAQLIGSIAGYGLAWFVSPNIAGVRENNSNFCNTMRNDDTLGYEFFAMEMACTFILVLLCCSVWDERNEGKQDSISIKFGIFLFAVIPVIGPFTGASLNPARTFGPSLINNNWDDHWMYWLAPISGGILASLFYKFLFVEKKQTNGRSSIEG